MIKRKLFLIGILCLLLSCINSSNILSDVPEHFTTRIFDNGIKQFELQLQITEKQKDQLLKGKLLPGMTPKRMQELLIKRLELRLAQNHYCRQGYMLTNEFSTLSLGDLVIKGECVEGASFDDKKVFPNG